MYIIIILDLSSEGATPLMQQHFQFLKGGHVKGEPLYNGVLINCNSTNESLESL